MGPEALASRERVRHPRLDHEPATRLQVVGRPLEHRTWASWSGRA